MLIVGLGNFGKEFISTIHNVGFMTIDALANLLDIKLSKKNYQAKFFEGKIGNEKVIIAQPLTYMNASGVAVSLLAKKFKIDNEKIIVIYDDIDLPEGKIRFRKSGSGGTHNGMKSVVSYMGENVARIRIGVGKNETGSLADYVLTKMKGDKKEKVKEAIKRASQAIFSYLESGDFSEIENLNK